MLWSVGTVGISVSSRSASLHISSCSSVVLLSCLHKAGVKPQSQAHLSPLGLRGIKALITGLGFCEQRHSITQNCLLLASAANLHINQEWTVWLVHTEGNSSPSYCLPRFSFPLSPSLSHTHTHTQSLPPILCFFPFFHQHTHKHFLSVSLSNPLSFSHSLSSPSPLHVTLNSTDTMRTLLAWGGQPYRQSQGHTSWG